MGERSRNSREKHRKTKPQRTWIRCGFLVGAGGLREPRRKGTRVAAPSGCIVPWAARASCWPQPQQLLPASAAGSGRRCCTGLFLRRLQRRRRSCSNPPPRVKLKIPDKTKNQRIFYAGLFGGRGWIRTTEAESSRFTVCPHWPLGNTPIFIFVRPFAGRLAYFSMGNGFCQLFFTFFFKGFLRPSKAGCGNVDGFVRKRRTSVFFAAKIFIG